jgi:SAM-dependent methyltransferase
MGHKIHYLRALAHWSLNGWRRKSRHFTFAGKTYEYFHHRYNLTWLNERRIEIPIIRDRVAAAHNANILEIGHVLRHYEPDMMHPVVDLYETSRLPGVFLEDAEHFQTGAPFDLIISISTLEHVGWDETPRDEDKIRRTLHHLRSLLTPTGELLFTCPIAYSPPLDRVIEEGEGFVERRCMIRINARNEWEETDWATARECRFHHPYPFANGLVIARMKGGQ